MKAAVLEGIKKITIKSDVAEPVIGPAFGQAVGACPGMTGC